MNDFILQFCYKRFFHSGLGPLQLIVSISFKKMLYIFCFFYTFLTDYVKCGVFGLLVDEQCGGNQGPCSKTAGLTQKKLRKSSVVIPAPPAARINFSRNPETEKLDSRLGESLRRPTSVGMTIR